MAGTLGARPRTISPYVGFCRFLRCSSPLVRLRPRVGPPWSRGGEAVRDSLQRAVLGPHPERVRSVLGVPRVHHGCSLGVCSDYASFSALWDVC
jgi:hypothetical protein